MFLFLRNKKLIVTVMSLTFSTAIFSADLDCFPDNDLSFPVTNQKNVEGPQKFQIMRIIERFKNVMQPTVAKRLKKTLKIELDWENPKVNASATRDENNNPVIVLLGGMARHPEMTPDGLLGILCHELGHHLGGAPKKKRGSSDKRSWSSAEGQADYFAANKCLNIFFNSPSESVNLDALSDKKEVDFAESRCGNDPICTRTALAGLSMAKVFASLKDFYRNPSLERNDHTTVWETTFGHPKPQCRLDTILAGAVCSVPPTQPFDSLDPSIGACYRHGDEAAKVSGERPRCWYNPENY